MSAQRQGKTSSNEGFAALLVLGAIVFLIWLVVKFIWLILGALSVVASLYAARAIIRANKRVEDEYAAYCAEVAANADQQVEWITQGDARGIFGPEAISLMNYIRSGDATAVPKVTTAPRSEVPRPLSRARRASPPAVVAGGIGIALLLAQVDSPAPSKTPEPPTPPRITINSPAPTQKPTTVTLAPTTIVLPPPSSSVLPIPEPTYAPPRTTFVLPPTYVPPPALAPIPSAPFYSNCSQAHADGRHDIPRGDPSYRTKLDRDGDGYACE